MVDHEYDFETPVAPGVVVRLRYVTEGRRRAFRVRLRAVTQADEAGHPVLDDHGDPVRLFEAQDLAAWKAETVLAGVVSVRGLNRPWPVLTPIPVETPVDFVEHAPADLFDAVFVEVRGNAYLREEEKKSYASSPASLSATPDRCAGRALSASPSGSPSSEGTTASSPIPLS